jgi:hypothetical protein
MDKSAFHCVLFSPVTRRLQAERLDHYVASVQGALIEEGFDSRYAEVLLEICPTERERDAALKVWRERLGA